MAKGQAKQVEIIYVEDMTEAKVVVTIGDTLRGQDWAREQYPDDFDAQEGRGGMYALFLAARRQRLPHTDGAWLDWLDVVTMPIDDDEAAAGEEISPGESQGPPSAS
jgi:hypothetical protein